jgi:hypothetical protein
VKEPPWQITNFNLSFSNLEKQKSLYHDPPLPRHQNAPMVLYIKPNLVFETIGFYEGLEGFLNLNLSAIEKGRSGS